MVMTEDFTAFGNEDAFVVFFEDSVMFGSSITGSNFTIDVDDVEETDDGGAMISYEGGSITFTADDTVLMASNNPDDDVLTINNPVYNYTYDAFFINGDIEGCDDFFVAFNNSGVISGSEDCGFVFAGDEDGAMVMTEDFTAFGNEDAFVVFFEDSVMFGSSITGSNFTIDVDDIEETDDGGAMISYEGGSTTFTGDNTVLVASNNLDDDVLTINNPVYNYTDDAFVISGDIEGCADFVIAFNNDGVLSGSKDCGFIAAGNEDGFIYYSKDKIVTGDEDGTSEILLDFGEDGDGDGSCKTIRELLCESPAADSFTIVCDLWTNSDSVNSNDGVSMTVFAPTDYAFATLYDLLDQADVTLDSKAAEKILMFHATPGMVMSTALDCTGTLEMFDSGSSRTKCGRSDGLDYLIQKGSGNRKNDIEPIIIAADIMACDDSVVHVVSEVMLPNSIGNLI